ncbi:unnamed protein product [Sphagnum troendelagicum]
MVKLLTRLINNTDKELSIYEESSNGALTRVALLRPKHVPTTTQTTNYESENSRSTQELPNSYVYSVDPNDSYATIRIWCGKQAVLSVSCEEVIDNSTITIEFKDGEFTKQLEPRNVKENLHLRLESRFNPHSAHMPHLLQKLLHLPQRFYLQLKGPIGRLHEHLQTTQISN